MGRWRATEADNLVTGESWPGQGRAGQGILLTNVSGRVDARRQPRAPFLTEGLEVLDSGHAILWLGAARGEKAAAGSARDSLKVSSEGGKGE